MRSGNRLDVLELLTEHVNQLEHTGDKAQKGSHQNQLDLVFLEAGTQQVLKLFWRQGHHALPHQGFDNRGTVIIENRVIEGGARDLDRLFRSEEHTSELQS